MIELEEADRLTVWFVQQEQIRSFIRLIKLSYKFEYYTKKMKRGGFLYYAVIITLKQPSEEVCCKINEAWHKYMDQFKTTTAAQNSELPF